MIMGIDFKSQDGRTNYLNEKLDNLLSGINASYGQILLDELVIRLQRTISDFNDEVEGIMGELKESSERRSQIMHDLMIEKDGSTGDGSESSTDSDESTGENAEMSAWEKRLEGK
jgi:hypothetical protein